MPEILTGVDSRTKWSDGDERGFRRFVLSAMETEKARRDGSRRFFDSD